VDTRLASSTWQVQAAGVHRPSKRQARPSGAPKQAAEARPSSRGEPPIGRAPRWVKIPPSEFASYAYHYGVYEICEQFGESRVCSQIGSKG
jgi:hypothetical protein